MRERAFGAFVELLSGKLSLKTLTYNVNFMFYVECILATVMKQMDLPVREMPARRKIQKYNIFLIYIKKEKKNYYYTTYTKLH